MSIVNEDVVSCCHSEYGETWHKGGMLANKQNCFDDFQYAAKYLAEHNYTQPQKSVSVVRVSHYQENSVAKDVQLQK